MFCVCGPSIDLELELDSSLVFVLYVSIVEFNPLNKNLSWTLQLTEPWTVGQATYRNPTVIHIVHWIRNLDSYQKDFD